MTQYNYETSRRSDSAENRPWFDDTCFPSHEYTHSVLEKVDSNLPRTPRRPIQQIALQICVQERWPEIMYQNPHPRITKSMYDEFLSDQDTEIVDIVAEMFLIYYRN